MERLLDDTFGAIERHIREGVHVRKNLWSSPPPAITLDEVPSVEDVKRKLLAQVNQMDQVDPEAELKKRIQKAIEDEYGG